MDKKAIFNDNKCKSMAVENTADVKSYSEKCKEKIFLLNQQVDLLKNSLEKKYQEIAQLKADVADKKKIRTKINPIAKKLNHVRFNLPNFLIIGTQKGGTTWLHENLKRHPQIYLPKGKKELEFFSYFHKKVADLGLNYYLEHFNQFEDIINPEKPKAIGEATPSYFWSIEPSREWTNPTNKYFNDKIPDSVFNVLGSDVKLILCLRDPVERAISAYFHHIRAGRIDYQSQGILEAGYYNGIIDMGFYSQHLNVWLETFSLDNFKVLIYERDIKNNKQQTIEQVCDFLQVDSQLFPPSTNLNKYHNQGLQYRIEADGVYLISSESDLTTMVIKPEEVRYLRKLYRADYLSLQKILDLDLANYWKFQ